jgi:hypothetical protein
LATDYIFRGQLGGREKNEEGKRKERKYNSILQHYTQLYGIVYYIYIPRLMSLSIYSSCHPWKISLMSYRGPSFIRPLYGI